jgi:hypothetical protein
MEQLIEQLLANLDSPTLDILPCYIDRPDKIQFRIGFNKGPKIGFQQETGDLYYLVFMDEKDGYYQYPIISGSDSFHVCQSIYHKIRMLVSDPLYTKMVEERISILLKNVLNLVKPIMTAASPKES